MSEWGFTKSFSGKFTIPTPIDIYYKSKKYGGNRPERFWYVVSNPEIAVKETNIRSEGWTSADYAFFWRQMDAEAVSSTTDICVLASVYVNAAADDAEAAAFIQRAMDLDVWTGVRVTYLMYDPILKYNYTVGTYPPGSSGPYNYKYLQTGLGTAFGVPQCSFDRMIYQQPFTESDDFYHTATVTSWDHVEDPDNPYGGGSGNELPDGYVPSGYDYLPFDSIPGLNVPAYNASDTGFCKVFIPSIYQLKALANFMWSPTFEQALVKLFSNPMEAILGLMVIPYPIDSGEAVEVKIGNVDTGLYMPPALSQFVTIPCGTVPIPTPTASYLDYNPYTKYWIYLPYCGTHPIDVDEVVGKIVGVQYVIDIMSGACIAEVTVNGTVMYTYSGQCGTQIPVTQVNFNQIISSCVSIAASIGSMIFSGGSTAPAAAGAIAGSVVNGLKEHVEKSGAIGGSSGGMAEQVPVLYGLAPIFCSGADENDPKYGQNVMQGYPQFKMYQLSALKGYTECEEVHLQGIPCTADELKEIESLLKSGVIIA